MENLPCKLNVLKFTDKTKKIPIIIMLGIVKTTFTFDQNKQEKS